MNATDNLALIAAARTAMLALLAFADEVLALCDKADANPEDGLRKVHTATLRQAAEKHLGSGAHSKAETAGLLAYNLLD